MLITVFSEEKKGKEGLLITQLSKMPEGLLGITVVKYSGHGNGLVPELSLYA